MPRMTLDTYGFHRARAHQLRAEAIRDVHAAIGQFFVGFARRLFARTQDVANPTLGFRSAKFLVAE
ncbi:hypothetical protein [Ferrovibrio sp.]|uniref:hypothetical protein n=1 Tax=Ferrovibrio sp. TaxID=1917215 RepID=UPI003D2A2AF6